MFFDFLFFSQQYDTVTLYIDTSAEIVVKREVTVEDNFVTIVSGLPRSGTSMMMQAVHAGGMAAVTDDIRKSDSDNPRGYYEFEPVKKTKEDPSWIQQATGKVVKMVYRLLYDLPADYEYRIIFMNRSIEEVLLSHIADEKLSELFKSELEKIYKWIDAQPNFSIVSVNYRDAVESPLDQCSIVNDFLGGNLDTDKMASAIDPTLYRNRH